MNFQRNVERLKLEHKISVREAIDLQNLHTIAKEAIRKIDMKKEDIKNGHLVQIARSPKEEIKALDQEAAKYKARIKELTDIVREAKKKVVPNYY